MRPVLIAWLGVLAGCVGHAPLSQDYPGPATLPDALVAELEPADLVAIPDLDEYETRRRFGFTIRDVTLPSVAGGPPIELEYYDPDGPERTPVVLVLPIFNGQPIVTRYFARYFAQQGWAALALHRERDPLEHIEDAEQAIRDNLADYRRVLDWVVQQPEHDENAIGLFGISLGAVDAVMLTALDQRVDALVAAMGGGDLSYLFMNTSYRRVSRTVNDLLEESGLTRDALQQRLDEQIATDPMALAPYVDAERVLMILTRNDQIVPFEAQQALRRTIGAPETVYLPTGHRTSIVYFPLLRNTAHDFFERRFGTQPELGAPVAPRGAATSAAGGETASQ